MTSRVAGTKDTAAKETVKGTETIAFDRLHALVARGYAPVFGDRHADPAFSSIELRHARRKGRNVPPPLTLWSNGLISTKGLLWPQHYVPASGGVPVWQKLIEPNDEACFTRFAEEVPAPALYDRYFATAFQKVQLCAYIAVCIASTGGTLPWLVKLWPAAVAAVV